MAAEHEQRPALTVRPANLGDAGRLAVLAGQLGYPATVEDIQRRLGAIQSEEEHTLWIAELADGQVAGWVEVQVVRVLVEDPLAEVTGLVVDESWRGRGIGRALMRRVEEWAGEQGCQGVYLRSNVVRTAAHAFYESLGYRIIKTQRAFRKAL